MSGIQGTVQSSNTKKTLCCKKNGVLVFTCKIFLQEKLGYPLHR